MIVIPAIDLKAGKCVRLLQGDFSRATVYSDQPVQIAELWQEKGAELIHVVDLEGSLSGTPQNHEMIKAIVKSVKVPVQVGGGIRDIETIESYLAMGVNRVILGTGALLHEGFIYEALKKYPGCIVLGVDAKDGRIAIKGWTEKTELTPVELVRRFEGRGLAAVIFTDINRDGMETGVNIEATKALAVSVTIPVIASGGVAGIKDIERLKAAEISGITGVIIGKALYNGSLDLAQAISKARG